MSYCPLFLVCMSFLKESYVYLVVRPCLFDLLLLVCVISVGMNLGKLRL
ncbi:hypothetical protein HanXRQr2_Chr02g0069071 [Helianthus annuus]|uniref:Uncharacterized protein n=1 Tax=Helianthus annuus TaxID=4232 RepID=A0A9K3JQD9_HELAN|nr:hypothetical protein HanXRQr2_Chr02g0069071 [Helianthus annuus]KAJ0952016.1 hypothetical protein HanPSC8_Chr02g0067231 [Helianthus annuus]